MTILNLGIVAHVDAGKTSLTERILYETHIIDEIGRVDAGNTQTDSLELEKRRGITIKASVVSFVIQDLKINLIDTPGHADFVAEVERAFSVLDAAVLVISAVEGIQAQTKFLMALLKKLEIPTMIFVNKIDRRGAQSESLIQRIKDKLAENVLPLYVAENFGTKQASIRARCLENDSAYLEECLGQLALNDEAWLAAYVNDEKVSDVMVTRAMTKQIREARLYPLFFGSAMTGIGVAELLNGLASFFATIRNEGKAPFPLPLEMLHAPLSGVVFKLEKASSGEKVAYVRIFSGSLNVREQVAVQRKTSSNGVVTRLLKVKQLHAFREGKTVPVTHIGTGDFGKVWGFSEARIGDVLGAQSTQIKDLHFVTPHMEVRIEPRQQFQRLQLYRALVELAEEDPLINVIQDTFHHEIYLRIFGEVQKEVIETLLLEQYGLEVMFSETRVVCLEMPVGSGQAVEIIGDGENPFAATVGFYVEPGPPDSGLTYTIAGREGTLPHPFFRAIEETVFETLKQGLYGWEVTDMAIHLTHTGYASPVTVAGDFRKLVPLVLMAALSQARTAVYEPLHQFELQVPAQSLSKVMFRLVALRTVVETPILRGDAFLLCGTLPVSTTEEFKRNLQALTEGEGLLLTSPGGWRKVDPPFPMRQRADNNPLNRKEYLLHISRAY